MEEPRLEASSFWFPFFYLMFEVLLLSNAIPLDKDIPEWCLLQN
jgi:hypothetical protein